MACDRSPTWPGWRPGWRSAARPNALSAFTACAGLRQVYGLRFRAFIPLDAGGPLTLQALEAGDIGVALLFSTDPAITVDRLVVLADDRGLQPAENVIPLVRRDVVTRYGPRLLAVLNTVSARLTTGSLRALDAQVELRGEDPRLVAESWLRDARAGLDGGARRIERDGRDGGTRGMAQPSVPPGSAARRTPRHRRPTGAPPPLPHPVSVTTRAWLVLAFVVLAGVIVISVRAPSLRLDDQVNAAVLRFSRGPGRRG